MSEPAISPGTRWAARAIGLVMAAAGAVLGWMGWSGLAVPLQQMTAGAPFIEFDPVDAVAMPFALVCLSLAAMVFLPRSDTSRGRGKALRRDRSRAATLLFFTAVAGLLLTVIAIPIARAAMMRASIERGYATCPPPAVYERRAPMRFVLTTDRCP